MTVWIAIARDKSFRTANPMSQIARGALLAFASAMAFAALRRMPVAEFTAIVMLTPLIATLMARFGLGERVSRLRWILVLLGFTGALIMALGKAPASTLMPFLYTQLAAAALAGWIAFGDAPDGWGWIGMALIGAAGATSAWLNVREAAARERPLTPVAASTLNE
jgi:drug/metabolite transporter (DMT)-like permease